MSQFQPPSQWHPQENTGYPQWQQQVQPNPPPMKPKPPGIGRDLGIVGCILVVVILLFVVIGAGIHATSTSAPTSSQQTATAQQTAVSEQATFTSADATRVANNQSGPVYQPTSQPTPSPTTQNDVGISQQSGDWYVTLNSAQTSYGDGAYTPKAGDTFLLVNLTARNTGTSNATMSDIDFSLRDSAGNTYGYGADSNVQDISGDVVANQQIRGYVIFEVSKSVHAFTLQFDGSFDVSQVVQWNIRV